MGIHHLTEGERLPSRITHYRWHGYKMMSNGLPVLPVVLVCSIVFFGCVAPDTFPEALTECEVLLQQVETVKKACFLDPDVKNYFKQADRSCPDWEDLSTLKSIEMVVAQRACKMPCQDVLQRVTYEKTVKPCIRRVDFYLELADVSCSDHQVDGVTHEDITDIIVEKACKFNCEDFLEVVETVKPCILHVDAYKKLAAKFYYGISRGGMDWVEYEKIVAAIDVNACQKD